MKVNIFSENPINYFGGGEKIIILLANYLTSSGFEVTVFEPDPSNTFLRVDDSEIEDLIGFSRHKLKFQTSKYHSPLTQNFPFLQDLNKEAISLILIRRFPRTKYVRELKKSNRRVLFCIHGITLEPLKIFNPLIVLHQLYMRLTIGNFSKELSDQSSVHAQVLTIGMKNALLTHGASQHKVHVIPNGIASTRHMAVRNDEEFYVVFMGRIENTIKGINRLKRVLLITARKEPLIRFFIMGTGRDSRLMDDLPSNTQYLGFVDENERSRILANSNLMLITSNLDPFPLTLLEGLGSGLPFVSTPISPARHILSINIEVGLSSSFSPRQISVEIGQFYKRWLADKEAYFKLRCRVKAFQERYFEETDMLSGYLDVINMMNQQH